VELLPAPSPRLTPDSTQVVSALAACWSPQALNRNSGPGGGGGMDALGDAVCISSRSSVFHAASLGPSLKWTIEIWGFQGWKPAVLAAPPCMGCLHRLPISNVFLP
jgi:hypothetical protein